MDKLPFLILPPDMGLLGAFNSAPPGSVASIAGGPSPFEEDVGADGGGGAVAASREGGRGRGEEGQVV